MLSISIHKYQKSDIPMFVQCDRLYWPKMKDLIFYAIASSVIALIAQLAGASLPVILFTSLLIPPVILIVIRVIR